MAKTKADEKDEILPRGEREARREREGGRERRGEREGGEREARREREGGRERLSSRRPLSLIREETLCRLCRSLRPPGAASR
ncbi:unnamed protein product [Spirodela intermedia]|uniref:Uncharacterized protein n=1 Tax=Spirodela intermedia TaxID=51605 RepID=A0A7I8IKW8_SPIIN|nr:unnamed protein product [Spirodela intermedia]CAA6657647.1 unnamed protein product [Spirodela intermedia]